MNGENDENNERTIDLGAVIGSPALPHNGLLEPLFRVYGGGLETTLELDRMVELDAAGQRGRIAELVQGLRVQMQCAVS